MNGTFQDVVLKMAEVTPEPEDYTGEDGLLYCGKCHTPKQFRMGKPPFEASCSPISASVSRNGVTGRKRNRQRGSTLTPWRA